MRAYASALALVAIPLAGCETLTSKDPAPVQALSGEWTVDLRPSFEDAPYDQPMVLTVSRSGEVTGTFYGSEISEGRAGAGQGRVCAAWRTFDNSGPYQHSGCLEGDTIVGQSWSEGRDFVLPWTARRD